jgi:glycosyltransferase involved in cell wall biosynthesis
LGSALQLLRFAAGRQCVWAGLKKTLFYKRPHADRHFLEFRGRVSFREMVHIYRSSSLVLGTLDVWNTFVLRTPLLKIHLRAFEVPMSAGISLCNRSDALCTMFREDHEMICYGSQDELVDKAAFWLQDSQAAERARIRSRARQRSVQDHSWGRRFQVLFSETGIPWPTAGQPVP